MGHPEHELLFVATQVARGAGLKDGSKQVRRVASESDSKWIRATDALGDNLSSMKPDGIHAPTWFKMYLFPESTVYQMLLRGHAPASEPFRKWVTEEVLPTIRKTGRFDLSESVSEGSAQFQEFRLKIEQVLEDQSLTGHHTGGGTLVHAGPFENSVYVPQLPVGHAMFFNGKAHRHYGCAVTNGERNLLVHWSEIK